MLLLYKATLTYWRVGRTWPFIDIIYGSQTPRCNIGWDITVGGDRKYTTKICIFYVRDIVMLQDSWFLFRVTAVGKRVYQLNTKHLKNSIGGFPAQNYYNILSTMPSSFYKRNNQRPSRLDGKWIRTDENECKNWTKFKAQIRQ